MHNPSRKPSTSKPSTSKPSTSKPATRNPEFASASGAGVSNASGSTPDIGPLRLRRLKIGTQTVDTPTGARRVTVDEAESPLAWLARRRGRDGHAMIAPHQLQAGEKLRTDFTRAHMMQRTTANWSSPGSSDRRGPSNRAADFTDATIAARQRVNAALKAVGPEFSGLLVDLCCFLKGLEDLERARGWPARSAKVVLQLALDRLARHYGYMARARGRNDAEIRTWLAEDAAFRVE
ncbi:MAG: DUF6456 domain-containing protein [Pseudolabrys sp.]|jgi:hypothetical protein